MRLATTDGLDRLSIGDLASHIGMSKSGLYAHFRSKEQLQLATIDAAEELFDEVVVEPAERSAPGLPRIVALADAFLDHLERRVFPGGCFFACVSAELHARPGPVKDRIREFDGRWQGRFREHAARARDAGELPAGTDLEQVVFDVDAFLLYAHAAFSFRSDPGVLRRAAAAVRGRLGLPLDYAPTTG